MISTIYRKRLEQAPLAEVILHILEEIGEVSDCLIRMYTYVEKDWDHIADEIVARQIRLEDELADVFSWLFGLVERLGMQNGVHSQKTENGRLLLSQILWTRYGSDEKRAFRCWSCGSMICSCPLRPIMTENEVADLLSKLSNSPKTGSL
jgi:NTP pyrophosphatase (non-canonical NTP hydrolase)